MHQEEALPLTFLELVAGPTGEQHYITLLDLERLPPAILEQSAGTNMQHLAFLRFILGRVRQKNAAGRLLLRFKATDHNPIAQRSDFHAFLLKSNPETSSLRAPGNCKFHARREKQAETSIYQRVTPEEIRRRMRISCQVCAGRTEELSEWQRKELPGVRRRRGLSPPPAQALFDTGDVPAVERQVTVVHFEAQQGQGGGHNPAALRATPAAGLMRMLGSGSFVLSSDQNVANATLAVAVRPKIPETPAFPLHMVHDLSSIIEVVNIFFFAGRMFAQFLDAVLQGGVFRADAAILAAQQTYRCHGDGRWLAR